MLFYNERVKSGLIITWVEVCMAIQKQKGQFFTGDVNQMATPATPVRLAMRLAMSMKS